MRVVNCNLCGADDYQVLFPKGFAQKHQIMHCNRCGLMYANPQEKVDAEDYAGVTDLNAVLDVEAPEHRQYHQKQLTQLPDNLEALRALDQALPSKGRLLEIGSFLGIFLDKIRADGW